MTVRIRLTGSKEEIREFLDDIQHGVNKESIKTNGVQLATTEDRKEFYQFLLWESPV